MLDFTSARKRMSIVVKEPKSGRIRLLSKGADSVMLPLLATGQGDMLRATEKHLEDHANDGLRTLLLTQKSVDQAEYDEWSVRYRRALTDLVELEKKEKELPNEIERAMSELEMGMMLVGSTAIEDKLQQGVPSSIADMGRAGISVWVLTGDKEETAINIAFACELFDTRTSILILNLKSHPKPENVRAELVNSGKLAAAAAPTGEKHALVIDGEVITVVMADPALQLAFLELTQNCQSVVACRCAPSQKAQLVELVKANVQGAISLAIGDGANDVAMIQAAHIGVGISGQEGMQAANSADFSFAQFRFLLPLLLQHGRNHYRRMATLVIYIFYKNIVLCLVMYWYVQQRQSPCRSLSSRSQLTHRLPSPHSQVPLLERRLGAAHLPRGRHPGLQRAVHAAARDRLLVHRPRRLRRALPPAAAALPPRRAQGLHERARRPQVALRGHLRVAHHLLLHHPGHVRCSLPDSRFNSA